LHSYCNAGNHCRGRAGSGRLGYVAHGCVLLGSIIFCYREKKHGYAQPYKRGIEDVALQHEVKYDGGEYDRCEKPRGHSCAISDIVADVIRYHGRVSWVVFWYARLDLAHKVGPDVGCLCVYASSYPGEKGYQRSPEPEADEHERVVIDIIESSQSEKRKTCNEHARDRAALHRRIQRPGKAVLGRCSGFDVCADRDLHAHVSCKRRKNCAGDERQCRRHADECAQKNCDGGGENSHGLVLPFQVSISADSYGRSNLFHSVVAALAHQHVSGKITGKCDSKHAGGKRQFKHLITL